MRPALIWNRSAACRQPAVKGYTNMVNSFYDGVRFEDIWLGR